MQFGRIVQSGTPAELYGRPANAFVAGFFGPINRYRGRVGGGTVETPVGRAPAPGLAEGTAVEAVVRPEALRVQTPATGQGLRARVLVPAALGLTLALHVVFYSLLRVPLPWGWLEAVAW
jgi:iron(III) transport system ATP-binding protein